jgi:excisionase family DNA binding protein
LSSGSSANQRHPRLVEELEEAVPQEREPEVLTVPELAALLRMNAKSAYDLVARGKIPGATKVGRLWRVHRPTVVSWLAGQISAPRPNGGRRERTEAKG